MSTHTPLDEIVQQANKYYQAENYTQAADHFAAAAELCRQAGDLATAAEMENNRSVALLQAGDAQGALDAAIGTDDVFAQAGDPRRQAMALGNQAAALEVLKQYDLAFEHYQRSSELLKAAGEQDLRAFVLKRIANLQVQRGDRLEAVATMHTALENQQKLSVKERALKSLMTRAMKLMGGK